MSGLTGGPYNPPGQPPHSNARGLPERPERDTPDIPTGIYIQDTDFTLHVGDVRDVLAELPAGSVHCVVTSPPYWGLRDYGTNGQLGLEPTPQEYVANMVAVFREVRRVLRDDGTLWLNLGDSYASDAGKGGSGTPNGRNNRGENYARPGLGGLKPKDLVGIPWRVAFALQDDGWYLRSDIIWAKPNPMPESVTDRPTKAHEYLFLLTKQPRYFFDQEAVREAHSPDNRTVTTVVGGNGSIQHRDGERWPNGGRNVRSVWEIATQPYPDAHFATFPEELPRRCIAAGCPEGGTVLDPFAGSGTTAHVARKLGRRSIGIELNPAYADLCAQRMAQLSLLA